MSYRCDWDDLGESIKGGDFDPGDPEDVAVLRFTLYQDGEEVPNGSYCTLNPVDSPKEGLDKLGARIIRAYQEAPYKRTLEECSWWLV